LFLFLEFTNKLLNAKVIVSTPFKTMVKVDTTMSNKYPDSNTLTIAKVTQGLHGMCMITGNNQIMYTPESGYSTRKSFPT